jgi:hypothetical protein
MNDDDLSAAIELAKRGKLALGHATIPVILELLNDTPLFSLGRLVFEPPVLESLPDAYLSFAIALHVSGIFGACSAEEERENERALTDASGRVLSHWTPVEVYSPKFRIVTERIEGPAATTVSLMLDA